MSTPDPVQPAAPSPLDGPALEAVLTEALAAVEAARDLDELKTVRLEHTGDRSALALANRQIGQLAPADKAAAGKLLGPIRGRLNQALAAQVLEAERDERVLVEESVDVTLPVDRAPPVPVTRSRRSRSAPPTSSRPWAGRSRRARRSRPSGSTSTRSTSVRTTRRGRCRTRSSSRPPRDPTASPASRRTWCCARTRHPCRPARSSSASCPCTSRAPARCSAPTSSTRRTRLSSTRSRASRSTRA